MKLKNLTIKELENYSPRGWTANYAWFHLKRKLIKIRKMKEFWRKLKV